MTQVCIVTGGTRGIGRAVAEALLARGASVTVTGTSADGAGRAARELGQMCGEPGRVAGLVCDVRDVAAVDAAIAATVSRFGGLDVLVNNAGVGVGAPVADLAHAEWDRIIGINLTGVFNWCHAAIPHLRTRGGGWIINVSSLSSTSPFAGGAAYTASKAGLNAFSEALMQELRDERIRVSCVLPGSVATEFSGRSRAAGAEWRLPPADVARAIVGLLDYDSRSLPSRIEIRPSRPQRG